MTAFRKGDRVKPSRKGLAWNLWRTGRAPSGGVVVRNPRGRSEHVSVLWEGRKTEDRLHRDFVSPQRKTKGRP